MPISNDYPFPYTINLKELKKQKNASLKDLDTEDCVFSYEGNSEEKDFFRYEEGTGGDDFQFIQNYLGTYFNSEKMKFDFRVVDTWDQKEKIVISKMMVSIFISSETDPLEAPLSLQDDIPITNLGVICFTFSKVEDGRKKLISISFSNQFLYGVSKGNYSGREFSAQFLELIGLEDNIRHVLNFSGGEPLYKIPFVIRHLGLKKINEILKQSYPTENIFNSKIYAELYDLFISLLKEIEQYEVISFLLYREKSFPARYPLALKRTWLVVQEATLGDMDDFLRKYVESESHPIRNCSEEERFEIFSRLKISKWHVNLAGVWHLKPPEFNLPQSVLPSLAVQNLNKHAPFLSVLEREMELMEPEVLPIVLGKRENFDLEARENCLFVAYTQQHLQQDSALFANKAWPDLRETNWIARVFQSNARPRQSSITSEDSFSSYGQLRRDLARNLSAMYVQEQLNGELEILEYLEGLSEDKNLSFESRGEILCDRIKKMLRTRVPNLPYENLRALKDYSQGPLGLGQAIVQSLSSMDGFRLRLEDAMHSLMIVESVSGQVEFYIVTLNSNLKFKKEDQVYSMAGALLSLFKYDLSSKGYRFVYIAASNAFYLDFTKQKYLNFLEFPSLKENFLIINRLTFLEELMRGLVAKDFIIPFLKINFHSERSTENNRDSLLFLSGISFHYQDRLNALLKNGYFKVGGNGELRDDIGKILNQMESLFLEMMLDIPRQLIADQNLSYVIHFPITQRRLEKLGHQILIDYLLTLDQEIARPLEALKLKQLFQNLRESVLIMACSLIPSHQKNCYGLPGDLSCFDAENRKELKALRTFLTRPLRVPQPQQGLFASWFEQKPEQEKDEIPEFIAPRLLL